jgi:hypothetical protein
MCSERCRQTAVAIMTSSPGHDLVLLTYSARWRRAARSAGGALEARLMMLRDTDCRMSSCKFWWPCRHTDNDRKKQFPSPRTSIVCMPLACNSCSRLLFLWQISSGLIVAGRSAARKIASRSREPLDSPQPRFLVQETTVVALFSIAARGL